MTREELQSLLQTAADVVPQIAAHADTMASVCRRVADSSLLLNIVHLVFNNAARGESDIGILAGLAKLSLFHGATTETPVHPGEHYPTAGES